MQKRNSKKENKMEDNLKYLRKEEAKKRVLSMTGLSGRIITDEEIATNR